MGALALAPLLASCGESDVTPPELVDAQFENQSLLVLTFSEPIAAVDAVTPETHFRLDAAFDLANLGETAYYDLSTHFTGEVPGQDAPLAEQWPRHEGTTIARVEAGDDPSQLRLYLSIPVDPYACETLLAASALDIPAGIHLHYAQASQPRVTDLAGNELADIAPWWVEAAPAATYTQGPGFPELDPRMPIPCPAPP